MHFGAIQFENFGIETNETDEFKYRLTRKPQLYGREIRNFEFRKQKQTTSLNTYVQLPHLSEDGRTEKEQSEILLQGSQAPKFKSGGKGRLYSTY